MDAQPVKTSSTRAQPRLLKSGPKRPGKAAALGQDDNWPENPHELKEPCSLMPPAEQHEIELKKFLAPRKSPHRPLVLRRSPSGFDSGVSHLSAPRFSSKELN